MPKHQKPGKKQIEQCDHKEASRTNSPPVGLVTPETDRDAGKKTYAYDPHIDLPYGIKYGSNFLPFVNRRELMDYMMRSDLMMTVVPTSYVPEQLTGI